VNHVVPLGRAIGNAESYYVRLSRGDSAFHFFARQSVAAAVVLERFLARLRLAPALETLDALLASGAAGTFDFAFIDAAKSDYPDYHERIVQLLGSGGLAVYDNVLWNGDVIDDSKTDADTVGVRRLNERLATDERVTISMIPVADGLTLALKR